MSCARTGHIAATSLISEKDFAQPRVYRRKSIGKNKVRAGKVLLLFLCMINESERDMTLVVR